MSLEISSHSSKASSRSNTRSRLVICGLNGRDCLGWGGTADKKATELDSREEMFCCDSARQLDGNSFIDELGMVNGVCMVDDDVVGLASGVLWVELLRCLRFVRFVRGSVVCRLTRQLKFPQHQRSDSTVSHKVYV
jgi:hypothetical protein